VHLQTRSISASKYILKERWRVYGDTGVTEVARVKGSIYLADPGVDRHHPISISSNHKKTIHTLSFPTFGLTHSVRKIVDPRNCVGSSTPGSIISSHPIPTLLEPEPLFEPEPVLNQKRSFSWMPFWCPKRCGGVLMVGYQASSSIVSPERPPNVASLNVLSMGVAWCYSNYARVPSAARLTLCIYRERLK